MTVDCQEIAIKVWNLHQLQREHKVGTASNCSTSQAKHFGLQSLKNIKSMPSNGCECELLKKRYSKSEFNKPKCKNLLMPI